MSSGGISIIFPCIIIFLSVRVGNYFLFFELTKVFLFYNLTLYHLFGVVTESQCAIIYLFIYYGDMRLFSHLRDVNTDIAGFFFFSFCPQV